MKKPEKQSQSAVKRILEAIDATDGENDVTAPRGDLVIVLGALADQRSEMQQIEAQFETLKERSGVAIGLLLFLMVLSLFF